MQCFNVSSAAIPLPLVIIFGGSDGVVGGQAARGRRLAGEESLPRAAHRTSNFTTFVVICAKVNMFRPSFDSYGKFDILLVTRCGTAPYYICTWCWRRGRLHVGGIHVSLPPERPQAAVRVNQHERRHRQHDGDRLHQNRRCSLLGSANACLAGCVKSLPVPKGRRIEGLGQDKPLTPTPRL